MASSEIDAMSGVMRIPTTMPPASAEWSRTPKRGLRTSGDRKLMAKKPSTMVGIPAIVSRTGLTMLRTRFEAYSDSRIADSNPSGIPMSIAMIATSSVPLTSARTPNW